MMSSKSGLHGASTHRCVSLVGRRKASPNESTPKAAAISHTASNQAMAAAPVALPIVPITIAGPKAVPTPLPNTSAAGNQRIQ